MGKIASDMSGIIAVVFALFFLWCIRMHTSEIFIGPVDQLLLAHETAILIATKNYEIWLK